MRREEPVPVQIYPPVRKIIRDWPVAARRELGATLLRLQRGELIGMPDVRAMPSVAKGNQYRVEGFAHLFSQH